MRNGINYTGSGSGSASHDYSTTEHKIGTWIDGSDLYEKTYLYHSIIIVTDHNYGYSASKTAIRSD